MHELIEWKSKKRYSHLFYKKRLFSDQLNLAMYYLPSSYGYPFGRYGNIDTKIIKLGQRKLTTLSVIIKRKG